MIENLKFPDSFPNKDEEIFLKLISSKNEDFVQLWQQWKKNIVFDDIDFATLRLLPTLYLKLKNFDIQDEITGRIKGAYKLSWFKNQMLIESVKKLVLTFNNHNIPVLLLKGIPLLLNVYKDIGARFLGDADILVDPKYALEVSNLMLNNGWEYKSGNPSITSDNKLAISSLNRTIHATTFINDKNIEIDIHWNVFHITDKWSAIKLLLLKDFKPKIYNKQHWENSIEINIRDVKCRTLCIEDTLIHIIAHAAFWNTHRTIRWVIDSISIIRNFDINWKFLIENIKEFDLNIEFYFAMSYLIKNYELNIPSEIINEISKLKLDETKLKHYYKINEKPKPNIFGNNFPFTWYIYWSYEPKKSFPLSFYYFMEYLSKTWNLTHKRQIPLYILGKYKKLISRYYQEYKSSKFDS